ncbi:MAG: HlyD family efflux transporter periplasmic adaptor subunit [Clostridiaceae bacterium]
MSKADAKEKMEKVTGNGKTYYLKNKSGMGKTNEVTVAKPADKGKSTIKRLTLGSLMLFFFMMLYIPSLLNWLSGNNITSDVIRIGTIEESVHSNGIIVRDEELLKAPGFEGRYEAVIGEGERTPAYSCIATVYNDTSDTLLQKLKEIDMRIAKAHMEKAEKTAFFSEDLAKLDDEIGLQVQNVILACNARSFEDLSQYRNEIDKIVGKKAEIVGESSTDSYIDSMKKQKVNVQNQLNSNTFQVISNISGVVSYAIDGYESILTPKNLSELTPEMVDGITKKNSPHENDGKAYSGTPLAKIIKGTDIYIAAAMGTDDANRFKVDDKIKLRINDIGMETSGYIVNINEPKDGKSVLVVRANRGADVLSSTRKVNVDFISRAKEGFKVPLRCLRDISSDGTAARIMLIRYKVATARTVEIICRDEEYAIIGTPEGEIENTVNLYDIYIINPDNIKEGDIIEK